MGITLGSLALSTMTSRATHAHPTSPRSTGFCAIWDCISSSSSSLALSTKPTHPSYVIGSGSAPVLVPRMLMCRLTRDFNATSPLTSSSFSFVSSSLLEEESVALPPPPLPLPPGPPPRLTYFGGRVKVVLRTRSRFRPAKDMRDETMRAHS